MLKVVPSSYTFVNIRYMNSDHETNFGYWVDKPDRPERPSAFAPIGRAPRKSDFVWRHLVLIVVLALTLILSVVMLAAHR